MHVLHNQSSENVKSLLTEMLSHKSSMDRSFDAIKKKVGGFTDDEVVSFCMKSALRKLLEMTTKKSTGI